jgi:hypothetical protein
MEAENTSETSVNVYQTTRRNSPENSHLHTRRRENLKSHYESSHCNFINPVVSPQHLFSKASSVQLCSFLKVGKSFTPAPVILTVKVQFCIL